MFSFMVTTLKWFLEDSMTFFTVAQSWHWELGSPIEEGRFYIGVIKNFCCFFRVVFKDSVLFKSNAIISYDFSISEKGFDCIPKWFTTFFCCYFLKIHFFSIIGHVVAFVFFIFIGHEVFPRGSLVV